MPNQSRQLNHASRIKRKKLGKKMDKVQWFIGKNINRKTFYVADHDNQDNTTMWSANRRESLAFLSENACYKYIHRYLNDRTDVILVNVLTSTN